MAKAIETDPLKPSMGLLVKLGSALVHEEELAGPDGHQFNVAALQPLLADAEVQEWIEAMNKLSLLPVKH